MTYLSPVIAIVATLLLGALLFLALGKDPLAGLKVFLVDPFKASAPSASCCSNPCR
jgi:simple sugar transport system permease protein